MHERDICVELTKIMQHFSVEVKNLIKEWNADLRITKREFCTLQCHGPHTLLGNNTWIIPLKPGGRGGTNENTRLSWCFPISDRESILLEGPQCPASSHCQASKKATNLEQWHDNHGAKDEVHEVKLIPLPLCPPHIPRYTGSGSMPGCRDEMPPPHHRTHTMKAQIHPHSI